MNFPSSPLISSFQEVYNHLGLNKETSVLDVGCGLGPNVYLKDVWDFKYTGIDPSRHAIAAAHEKWNRSLDLENPKFEVTTLKDFAKGTNDSFDVVLDRASLQHIDLSEYDVDHSPIRDIHQILSRRSHTKNGFLISQWASKSNDLTAITKNFKTFTGFEEFENEIRKYFVITKLTRINSSNIVPENGEIVEYLMVASAKIL